MKKLINLFQSKRTYRLALWAGLLGFLLFSLVAVQTKHNSLKLKSIQVKIEPQNELAFLDSAQVLALMKGQDTGRFLLGALKEDLNIDLMESALERYPFIEQADVALDLSGRLIVKIKQRSPVLRVINKKGESYYVAKNGFKMPMHSGFAPHVLIANGNIAESLADSGFVSTPLLRDLLLIANYCKQQEFWDAQIEQMYVDNYIDILLIPKVGNHSIVFGSAEQFEKKFTRLKTFYTEGLNQVGWDQYKRINLKFKNQIVAEKKN